MTQHFRWIPISDEPLAEVCILNKPTFGQALAYREGVRGMGKEDPNADFLGVLAFLRTGIVQVRGDFTQFHPAIPDNPDWSTEADKDALLNLLPQEVCMSVWDEVARSMGLGDKDEADLGNSQEG